MTSVARDQLEFLIELTRKRTVEFEPLELGAGYFELRRVEIGPHQIRKADIL